MLLLPNGNRIDLGALLGAFGDGARTGERYLDLDTGSVVRTGGARRVLVPRVTADRKLAWMLELVGEISCDHGESPARELLAAMGSGSSDNQLEACYQILEETQHLPEEDGGGWIHGWVQLLAFKLDDALAEWLETAGTGAIEREEFCTENCGLCRALQDEEDRRVAGILAANAIARGETSAELTDPARWRARWYPGGLPPETESPANTTGLGWL